MESQETLDSDMEHLIGFRQQISASLASALIFMRRQFKPLRRAGDKPNSGGWRGLLQEKADLPTVTGTACVISAMIAAGEGRHSEYTAMGKRLIIDCVRKDGGWSMPAMEHYTA